LYPMDIVVYGNDGRWRHYSASASGLTIMRSLYRPHGIYGCLRSSMNVFLCRDGDAFAPSPKRSSLAAGLMRSRKSLTCTIEWKNKASVTRQ